MKLKSPSVAMLAILATIATAMPAQAVDLIKEKGRLTNAFTIDLDGDGLPDTVTLVKADNDKFPEGIVDKTALEVKSKGRAFSIPVKDGLSVSDSGIRPLVISDHVRPFVALVYFVPYSGHIWIVRLYSFDGKAVREELAAYSDTPSLEILDTDGDNVLDIVTINRDMRGNPALNRIKTTYQYKDNKWRPASTEKTTLSARTENHRSAGY